MTNGSQIPSVRIRLAGPADVDVLVCLINEAFLVERPIFDGDRTNPESVRTFLQEGKFLIMEDSAGLAGCVYVEPHGDRGYIGLLSVDPNRQGSGLGRKLMEAAEEYLRGCECSIAELRVVSARTPLPAFYSHLGYAETHRTEIPAEVRPKVPSQFIHMSKMLRSALPDGV